MNGVTTMGRGLITLHARGEEPGNVPMSVQDLIGAASYQFRKSHLGVLQTVRSHPEISERLMMNQIGWNNMLMRLFKTKEKLAKPVVNAELASNAEGGMRNAESLPDAQAASNHGHALPEAAALMEPGALCAPRAFSSLDGSKSPAVSRRNALNASQNKCGILNAESSPNSELGFVNSEAHISEPEQKAPETEAPEALTEKKECGSVVKETTTCPAEEKFPEAKTQGKSDEPKGSDPEKESPDDPEAKSDAECEIVNSYTCKAKPEKDAPESESPEGKELPGRLREGEPLPDVSDDGSGDEQLHETGQPADDPPGLSSGPVEGPFYLEILRHAFSRSADNEDGKIIFTGDELCYLAQDPDFAKIYPDQAADMRRILAQLDGGTVT